MSIKELTALFKSLIPMWIVSFSIESGWIMFLVKCSEYCLKCCHKLYHNLTVSRQNGSTAVSVFTAQEDTRFLYCSVEIADKSPNFWGCSDLGCMSWIYLSKEGVVIRVQSSEDILWAGRIWTLFCRWKSQGTEAEIIQDYGGWDWPQVSGGFSPVSRAASGFWCPFNRMLEY